MGMIFDETYRPFFESAHSQGLYDPRFGLCQVELTAVASRTGRRADAYRQSSKGKIADFASYKEPDAIGQLLQSELDFVCIATPDNRHFECAKAALQAGKHVLIEKPSVLSLEELDELQRIS